MNLLIEKLPLTLHQLRLHLRFLPLKKTDGFKTVTYKKKTITDSLVTVKYHQQPLIGVQNSASLPIISKKERLKALLIS
jgi:hypothetical protein